MNKTYKETNESLESKVESNSIFSKFARKVKNAVAGTVLGAVIASGTIASEGCSAPHYTGQPSVADVKLAKDMAERDLGGVDNAVQNFTNGLKISDGKLVYSESPLKVQLSDSFYKFIDEENDEISNQDYKTIIDSIEQTKMFDELTSRLKFKRVMISDLDKNFGMYAFKSDGDLSNTEKEETMKKVIVLEDNLKKLTNSDIKKVADKINAKAKRTNQQQMSSEFDGLQNTNDSYKREYEQYAKMVARWNESEFISNAIYANLKFADACKFSRTGKSMLSDGKQFYETILKNKKLKEIASPDSKLFTKFSYDPNKTVDELVKECLSEINEEAESNSADSRHNIANKWVYIMRMTPFSAAKERQLVEKSEESNLKNIKEYNDVNYDRCLDITYFLTETAVKELKDAINKDQGLDWVGIGTSWLPIYAPISMFLNGRRALCPNTLTLKEKTLDGAIKEATETGYIYFLSAGNREHFAGDNSKYLGNFISGAIGTAFMVGGLVYGITSFIDFGGNGTQTSGGAGSGPAFGGENGGPGTGN